MWLSVELTENTAVNLKRLGKNIFMFSASSEPMNKKDLLLAVMSQLELLLKEYIAHNDPENGGTALIKLSELIKIIERF